MPRATIAVALAVYSLVLLAFVFAAHHAVTAAVGLFLLGFVGLSAGPALMGRLMDFAAEGPSLAAASFHSAFNVANAVGAAIGGLVLEEKAETVFRTPALTAVMLIVAGALLWALLAIIIANPALPAVAITAGLGMLVVAVAAYLARIRHERPM